MFKGFGNVLMKELKELIRDPKILVGMIIVPLLMFPILGAVMSYAVQSAQQKAQEVTILVLNNDQGNWSQFFIDFVNASIKVEVLNNVSAEQVVSQSLLANYNSTEMIEIPSGFSYNLTEHWATGGANITAHVKVYGVFSGGSVFENVGSTTIDFVVQAFNRAFAPDFLFGEKSAIVKGRIEEGIDPSTLAGLTISQTIAMPITIMILLTYSMQIAATSVAMEKEEKTLETLLTLPVDRFAILMGKLSGSIVVAGIGALAYMIGYNYMLGSFTGSIPGNVSADLASLGLVPSLLGYVLLGVSLFVTLLSALALAIIISAFAEDVRGAQSVVGYIYPVIFIPSFLLMYLDVNSLPLGLRLIVYAIPYAHPIIAAKAVIMGDYLTPILGIVYVSAFTMTVMYVASRMFATEKILTAKLRFRGLRGRKNVPAE